MLGLSAAGFRLRSDCQTLKSLLCHEFKLQERLFQIIRSNTAERDIYHVPETKTSTVYLATSTATFANAAVIAATTVP